MNPADTTATIAVSAVCPKCGTIAKSGKKSCCGRGGSWFKNCGGIGNTKLQHTWHEGTQACKARSQSNAVIVGQQPNVAQLKGIDSSQGVGMANDESVIAATRTVAFMSVNTPTPMPDTTPIVTSTYMSDSVLITPAPALTLMTKAPNILMIYSTHTSDSNSITTQTRTDILKIQVFIFLLVNLLI